MATLEKTPSSIIDVKSNIRASIDRFGEQAVETFTELGINFNKIIVDVDLQQLIRAPYHSRIPIESRIESLKDSLETYGFLGGIFVSAKNNQIIDGWYRKEIWEILGHTSIPCFMVDCTKEQEKRIHLKLNVQVATFDLTDYGLTFPGINLVEDYGFSAADLNATNPPSRSEKAAKPLIENKLMRFHTLLQAKQYQRLKAFKEQNSLENWADVIDMLLENYEAR